MATENSALLEGNDNGGSYELMNEDNLDVEDEEEEVKSEDALAADRRWLFIKISFIIALGILFYFLWRWGVWQWMWGGISSVNWAFWESNNDNKSDSNDAAAPLKNAAACVEQDQDSHLSRVMSTLFHLESVTQKAPDDFTALPKICAEAERFCNASSAVLATVTNQRCRNTCGACDESDVAISDRIGGKPPCTDDSDLLTFFLKRAKTTQAVDHINNCSEAAHLCDADTQYLAQGIQVACKKTCGTCTRILKESQEKSKELTCEVKESDGCYFGSNKGCCEGETCVPPAFKKSNTGYYEMKTRAKVISYCELSQTLLDLDVTLSPHCYCLSKE